MDRHLLAYAYVHRSFEEVCRLLSEDPAGVLGSEEHAGGRTDEVVIELHVEVAGRGVGKAARVEVGRLEREAERVARLPLRWQAEGQAGLFPTMVADLEVYPLAFEPRPLTQLVLVGHYRPPLWLLGAAADGIAGHRVAESAVHQLVEDVRSRIEHELGARENPEAGRGEEPGPASSDSEPATSATRPA